MAGAGAEDLAQEIFVKLYLALDRFDPKRPLAPFLFRIAHNHCLDALKKRKVPTLSLVRDDDEDERETEHADEKPTPEDLVQRAEVLRALEEALASMPAAYRSALIMWHVEGLSYEEISAILGVPMGTVKARIHRGREKLQQKLGGLVLP
jgi:RNA polymerase sigma-70 factor (ECF subfamily)